MARKREGGKKRWGEKKGDFGSRTELHRVVDAPRRGPAAGIASRRDRWGKEGTGEYIYYKLLLLFANSSFASDLLASCVTTTAPAGSTELTFSMLKYVAATLFGRVSCRFPGWRPRSKTRESGLSSRHPWSSSVRSESGSIGFWCHMIEALDDPSCAWRSPVPKQAEIGGLVRKRC